MKTNIGNWLAAVAFVLAAAAPAHAGKGGSARNIQTAVASGSVDAIIAEVERAEALNCDACVQLVTNLTAHSRYEVREVAAWWFAKRPALAKALAEGFVADLGSASSLEVRNAADFLGATITYTSLPALRATIKRTDLTADAKIALVRAVRTMAHQDGNPVLISAMADGDAGVRAAAVAAWREIRGQQDATPVAGLLVDGNAKVRAEAAAVVGALRAVTARAALEGLLAGDADPFVRRNAAWALGRLGQSASREVLVRATTDTSGLVRMTAKAALASLR